VKRPISFTYRAGWCPGLAESFMADTYIDLTGCAANVVRMSADPVVAVVVGVAHQLNGDGSRGSDGSGDLVEHVLRLEAVLSYRLLCAGAGIDRARSLGTTGNDDVQAETVILGRDNRMNRPVVQR
jgi:hypothetical protein